MARMEEELGKDREGRRRKRRRRRREEEEENEGKCVGGRGEGKLR